MTFELPALLWLLILLPLAVWALLYWERQRQRRRSEYADPALLGTALQDAAPRTRWLLAVQLAALGLLLLGAAQPNAQVTLPSNQAAVMIALDTSRSMLADDLKPTRLAAAEEVIRQFLKQAPHSTRVGFLTFSERASVMVPPTTDRQAVLDALERVKPAQATSLSGALVSAVRALPGREKATPPPQPGDPATAPPATPPAASPPLTGPFPPGAVLLLSDGISNRGGDPLIAAKFAQTHEVKVYTVALGKEGGAVSQIGGQTVFVPFDAQGLQRLAQLTGGEFLSTTDPEALGQLTRNLGTEVRWASTELILSAPLAGLAVLLLIMVGALSFASYRRLP
ncbi:VWA domain-containing protein [Deinococcus sp.]|uniref:VWA domain-containing protein n=1 Tax=Deinococcus sp. TaxID=47478 RepID=UPI003B5AEF58